MIWLSARSAIESEQRIEAHIFVAFIAYCLHVTLRRRLYKLASGLTLRDVLEKFKTVKMVDVHLPTTDRRTAILLRYTQLKQEHRMLLHGLNPELSRPAQTTNYCCWQTGRLTLLQCGLFHPKP